jgi:hypothetical protein
MTYICCTDHLPKAEVEVEVVEGWVVVEVEVGVVQGVVAVAAAVEEVGEEAASMWKQSRRVTNMVRIRVHNIGCSTHTTTNTCSSTGPALM